MVNRWRKCPDVIGENRYQYNIDKNKAHIVEIKRDLSNYAKMLWIAPCGDTRDYALKKIDEKKELLKQFKDGLRKIKKQRREWRASYYKD